MKQIEFIPIDKLIQLNVDYPEPSSKFIPNWYKKTNVYIDNQIISRSKKNPMLKSGNLSVKSCAPFFDALTSGYMVTLASDIYVVNPEEYKYRILWDCNFSIVGEHIKDQVKNMPAPYKDYEVFKWFFHFRIKTPKNYSCIFTHPKFLYDVPFTTIDGVVDTDKYHSNINFPFFLDNNFNGKISKGTPICQIFPFKREEWKSKKSLYKEKNNYSDEKINLFLEKGYKKLFWSRKRYG